MVKAAKTPEDVKSFLEVGFECARAAKKTTCCSSENVNRHHTSKVDEISKKVAEVR